MQTSEYVEISVFVCERNVFGMCDLCASLYLCNQWGNA